MDQQMLDQIKAIQQDFPEVEKLLGHHQELDIKVATLTEKTYLTPEEDLELHQLKKEKLRIKDELEYLIHQKSA
ncbi:MAG: YdcH family protein [Deltaproteobacteria bacterium]|nr:YdcH family protein [Deltaproteobacteria bacterium]